MTAALPALFSALDYARGLATAGGNKEMEATIDTALDELTDLVDTPTAPPKVVPNVMLSHTAEGLVVGWDTCGGCGYHIRICNCPNGPTEPDYVKSWRPAPVTTSPTPVGKTDVVDGSSSVAEGKVTSSPVVLRTGPTCSGCQTSVSEENADKNDDGTWLCFECQTKGN